MTLYVPLKRGVTLIDEADENLLRQRSWYIPLPRRGCLPYVVASTSIAGRNGCKLFLHRLILGMEPDDLREGDHINGDTLDNRRSNLRIATPSQNQANRKRLTKNTAGFRGVTFHRRSGRWQACLKVNGRSLYLGLFDDPASAGRAYDVKALEMFGEFANLNFGGVA